MGTHRTRRIAAVVTTAVALLLTVGLTSCDPPPDTYVSLGDSYVAGPLIPDQSTTSLGCLRSNHNYPSLVRPQIKVTQFVDPSCSGATTADFATAQNVTPGPANPPQYDSLSTRDKVVTVGIGGNDIGFTDIIKTCAVQNPLGPGCKPTYVHDGHDHLRDKIDATAPKIAAALAEVHRRAPQAKVFLVGYPTIVPETGNGCYPIMPVLPSDTPYLRGVAKYLNAMLAGQASSGSATYVDTATSSIGHDYCSGDKWVEGIVPTTAAAPVHPNAKGMANTATVVTAAINAAVPN
jgi:hypothetical protein